MEWCNGTDHWSFLHSAGVNNAQSFSDAPPCPDISGRNNVLQVLLSANSQSASLFSDPGAFAVCVFGFGIRLGFMMAQQSAGCQDYFHAAICWPVGNFCHIHIHIHSPLSRAGNPPRAPLSSSCWLRPFWSRAHFVYMPH